MTKKDFIIIAKARNKVDIIYSLATALKELNPKFRDDLFIQACEKKETK